MRSCRHLNGSIFKQTTKIAMTVTAFFATFVVVVAVGADVTQIAYQRADSRRDTVLNAAADGNPEFRDQFRILYSCNELQGIHVMAKGKHEHHRQDGDRRNKYIRAQADLKVPYLAGYQQCCSYGSFLPLCQRKERALHIVL